MSFIPKRPAGGSDPEETRALQAMWDREFDPGTKNYVDTPQTKWEKRSDGTHILHINLRPSRGSGALNVPFRGEYLSTVVYHAGDMVVIASGANAGTYICTSENPGAANPPWVGGGHWLKLPSGNALGQWM